MFVLQSNTINVKAKQGPIRWVWGCGYHYILLERNIALSTHPLTSFQFPVEAVSHSANQSSHSVIPPTQGVAGRPGENGQPGQPGHPGHMVTDHVDLQLYLTASPILIASLNPWCTSQLSWPLKGSQCQRLSGVNCQTGTKPRLEAVRFSAVVSPCAAGLYSTYCKPL